MYVLHKILGECCGCGCDYNTLLTYRVHVLCTRRPWVVCVVAPCVTCGSRVCRAHRVPPCTHDYSVRYSYVRAVVRCTLYAVHCTLYAVHCTLYTVHCTRGCFSSSILTLRSILTFLFVRFLRSVFPSSFIFFVQAPPIAYLLISLFRANDNDVNLDITDTSYDLPHGIPVVKPVVPWGLVARTAGVLLFNCPLIVRT